MSATKKGSKPVANAKEPGSKPASQSPLKNPEESSKNLKVPQKLKDVKPIASMNAPVIKEMHDVNKSLPQVTTKDALPSKSLSPLKDASYTHLQPNKPLNPAEELEGKIKSRKRLLETLEGQTSFCSDETLIQIASRDSIIEELNKEIVILKVKVKLDKKEEENKKDADEKTKKIAELENEKVQLESKMLITVDKFRNEIQKLEEEKVNFELLQETMNEEIEVLRTQVQSKDEEVRSIVGDIKKLSEIIQQFKALNVDLNQKVEKQNEDYENMNTRYYEAEVKSANVGEIENSLQDYIRIYQQSESRGNKLAEEVRNFQILYNDMQGFCKFAEEQIEESVKSMDEENPSKKKLISLKNELGKKRKFEMQDPNEQEKDMKIRELNEKLAKAHLHIAELENSQKPLNDQLTALKDLLSKLKQEHLSSVENLNKTIKTVQDYSESIKSDLQALRSESQKKDAKIAALSSKLSASESKILQIDDKFKKAKENLSAVEKESNELKQKLMISKSSLAEKVNFLKNMENQNMKYVLNIQALHEEFWKKDTILIKLKKSMAQLQKSLSELSCTQTKTLSTKHSENAEKLMRELYEKDQKIEILKEMVKSTQNKTKEGKKGEGLSPDASVQEIPNEKMSKVSTDLLNSLVAKTINKFFTICSFHRNSPQDSSHDIQRSIKKLRQDLKSYSVFNVKDLQNSVNQLQYAFADSKPHISLDELIAVISKVVNV